MAVRLNKYAAHVSTRREAADGMNWAQGFPNAKPCYLDNGRKMSESFEYTAKGFYGGIRRSCHIHTKNCKILRYCPHCGTEMYGLWFYPTFRFGPPDKSMTPAAIAKEENYYKQEQQAIEDEIWDFAIMEQCPICRGQLSTDPGYFILVDEEGLFTYASLFAGHQNYKTNYGGTGIGVNAPAYTKKYWEPIGPFFTEEEFIPMREIREEAFRRNAEKYVDNLCEDLNVSMTEQSSANAKNAITSDAEKLTAYVRHLLELESGIYEITQRLKELYFLQQPLKTRADHSMTLREKAFHDQYRREAELALQEQLSKPKATVEEYNQELEKLQTEVSTLDTQIETSKPQHIPCAMDRPVQPMEPILQIPRFFNRKKVEKQNAILNRNYQIAMEEYTHQMGLYQKACEEAEANIKRLQMEHNEYIQELIKQRKTAVEEIGALKIKIAQMQSEIEYIIDAKASTMDIARPLSAQEIQFQLVDQEITQAETMLKDFYTQRNILYSLGVIFPKYRDMVAIASFSEFLETGRCSSLAGSSGCYNLYESECKANTIIAQLNQVIDSLEQIKNNQFTIYSVMQNVNTNLKRLNTSMDKALKTLSNIEGNTKSMMRDLDTISQNTDVIAYQSQQTTYYAKKNAELTNALGFMMALQ